MIDVRPHRLGIGYGQRGNDAAALGESMNEVKQGKVSFFAGLTILTLFGLFAMAAVHNGEWATIPYGAAASGLVWLGTYLSFFTYPAGRLGCATDVVVIVRGILSYSLVGVGIYMVFQWSEMIGAG